MLISFSLSNYRSFREEQTLSMAASLRHSGHEDHLISVPNFEEKLLPAAVIYGANGAGKSNLVKALNFVEQLVLEGIDRKDSTARRPFMFSAEWPKKPTEFEVRYISDGVAYSLGFAISDKVIESEWLYTRN